MHREVESKSGWLPRTVCLCCFFGIWSFKLLTWSLMTVGVSFLRARIADRHSEDLLMLSYADSRKGFLRRERLCLIFLQVRDVVFSLVSVDRQSRHRLLIKDHRIFGHVSSLSDICLLPSYKLCFAGRAVSSNKKISSLCICRDIHEPCISCPREES